MIVFVVQDPTTAQTIMRTSNHIQFIEQSLIEFRTYMNIGRALLELETFVNAADLPAPHDYASTLSRIILDEIKIEHARLRKLFAKPTTPINNVVKQALLTYCRERDENNQNTALSFSAFPDGAVNKCYWNIVQAFLKPQTLVEMLTIVSPQTQYMISLDLELKSTYPLGQKAHINDVQVRLTTKLLSQISNTPCPSNFSDIVFVNDICFDLKEFQHFDIERHIQCYDLFKAEYPKLVDVIYEHSNSLQRLKNDMERYQNEGQSPKQAITTLSKLLRLNGTSMTGRDYAGSIAWKACTDFIRYLNSLPSEIKCSLMELETSEHTKTSLEKIIKELEKGRCVEQASNHLNSLLDNKHNEAILNTTPMMKKTDLDALKRHYHQVKKEGLNLQTKFLSFLPKKPLLAVLRTIKIANENELISLLLALPFELYQTTLHSIDLKPISKPFEILSQYASVGIFSKQQSDYLMQALASNHLRFAPLDKAIGIAVKDNNPSLFIALIQNSSSDACLAALTHNKTALLWLVTQRECLVIVFQKLSEHQCRELIEHKDDEGNTLLHYAAGSHDCVSFLLDFYPVETCRELRERIVNERNNSGDTVLHCAHGNALSAKLILSCVKKAKHFKFINQQNNKGQTVLHLSDSSDVVIQLFNSVLIEQYRLLVNQQDEDGNNLLHVSADDAEKTTLILNYLPRNQRANPITCKNHRGVVPLLSGSEGSNVSVILNIMLRSLPSKKACFKVIELINIGHCSLFHLFASDEKMTQMLLEFYPAIHCFNALSKKNHKGETPLSLAAKNPKSMILMLSALNNRHVSEKMRFKLMKLRNAKGDALVHLTAKDIDSTNAVLDFCPASYHSSVLSMVNHDNESPLHVAAEFCTESFIKMLSCLINKDTLPNQRLQKLNIKTHTGKTLFHSAANNFDCLKVLFDYYPKSHYLSALTAKDYQGSITPLYWAANSNVLWCFSQLELTERTAAIKIIRFHKLRYNNAAESKEFLTLFENEAQQYILQLADKDGDTLLHHYSDNPEFLSLFLEIIPKEKHFKFIQLKNNKGVTVFHRACKNSKSLQLLYDSLNEDEWAAATDEQDNQQHRALFYVFQSVSNKNELYNSDVETYPSIDNALTFINRLPKNCPFKAVNQPLDENTRSLFELLIKLIRLQAAENTMVACKYINCIIDAFTPENYVKLLQEENLNENTLLHTIARKGWIQCLRVMLERLPKHERMPALEMKNGDGKKVIELIHWVYFLSSESRHIATLLPENELYKLDHRALMFLFVLYEKEVYAFVTASVLLLFAWSFFSVTDKSFDMPLNSSGINLTKTIYEGTFFAAKQIASSFEANEALVESDYVMS